MLQRHKNKNLMKQKANNFHRIETSYSEKNLVGIFLGNKSVDYN